MNSTADAPSSASMIASTAGWSDRSFLPEWCRSLVSPVEPNLELCRQAMARAATLRACGKLEASLELRNALHCYRTIAEGAREAALKSPSDQAAIARFKASARRCEILLRNIGVEAPPSRPMGSVVQIAIAARAGLISLAS